MTGHASPSAETTVHMDPCHSERRRSGKGDAIIDDPEEFELKHFTRIVNSFLHYSHHHKQKVLKNIRFYDRMPLEQQKRLHPYRHHLDLICSRISDNAQIMLEIARDSGCMFENRDIHPNVRAAGDSGDWRPGTKPGAADMEKTACVLRQIVREWTRDGQQERSQSFDVIVEAVDRYCGSGTKRQTRILVPGAGLGRLPFEIAKRGYATQGNEFSMFMLIASNFILNKCKQTNAFRIYPFVHQMNNVIHSSHQLRPVMFPDEDPSEIPPDVPFSMTAGNFIEVYAAPEYTGHFHCVVTCFFIDTAHNILQYMETIHKCLEANGVWINLGPLLYHFSDMPDEDSIEPCYEFVRDIILSYGFEFIEERQDVPSFYTQNSNSMLSHLYKCVFFVARKTPPTDSSISG